MSQEQKFRDLIGIFPTWYFAQISYVVKNDFDFITLDIRIRSWIKENLKHRTIWQSGMILCESKEDAALFKLYW